MATGIPGIKELKHSCPKSKGKFEGKAMVTWLYELNNYWKNGESLELSYKKQPLNQKMLMHFMPLISFYTPFNIFF